MWVLAGEGLYSGAKFSEGHILGNYWGCVALVLDSEANNFNWFGHEKRAIFLSAQPFTQTELDPANLYVIGSNKFALSYLNTVKDNATWLESAPLSFFSTRRTKSI